MENSNDNIIYKTQQLADNSRVVGFAYKAMGLASYDKTMLIYKIHAFGDVDRKVIEELGKLGFYVREVVSEELIIFEKHVIQQ